MTDIIVKDIKNGSEYYYGWSAEVASEYVRYDNTTSGMTSDNVQDALDEVNNKIEQWGWQIIIWNVQFGRQYHETSDTEWYLIGKASTYAWWVYNANNTPAYATNYYSTWNWAIYNGKYYNLGKLTSSQSNNKFIVVDLDTWTLTESDVEYAYRNYSYIKWIVNNYIYADDSNSYNSIKKFDLSFDALRAADKSLKSFSGDQRTALEQLVVRLGFIALKGERLD